MAIPTRYSFQYGDLVAHLLNFSTLRRIPGLKKEFPHHVFSPLHEFLVDNLTGIVFAGLDMNGLFDDSIGSAAECLSSAILSTPDSNEIHVKTQSIAALT